MCLRKMISVYDYSKYYLQTDFSVTPTYLFRRRTTIINQLIILLSKTRHGRLTSPIAKLGKPSSPTHDPDISFVTPNNTRVSRCYYSIMYIGPPPNIIALPRGPGSTRRDSEIPIARVRRCLQRAGQSYLSECRGFAGE